MAIAAPGGGKSYIYQVVNDICHSLESGFNTSILLESFSSAGLQRHQTENAGYALLCSDEGHRILATLNNKQSKYEGERALFNKLWGGQGETTALKDGNRGFKATSFSMAVFIQPSLCLSEISCMATEDGFFDRVVFMVSKPKHYSSQINKDSVNELNNYHKDTLKMICTEIYKYHSSQEKTYRFDAEAQNVFNKMSDEHAQEFNMNYPSESGILYI